jgi:hypothetical protein
MARSSVAPSLPHRPQWLSTPIGKTENGATVTDITLQPARRCELSLRLTIEFANDHREPVRYYRVKYTGGKWVNTTPDEPSICETIISWLEENVGAPPLQVE